MMLQFHGNSGPPFFNLESNDRLQGFSSGEVMGGVFTFRPNGQFGFQFNGRPFVGFPGQWMGGSQAADFEAFVQVWTNAGDADHPTKGEAFNTWVNLGLERSWGYDFTGAQSSGFADIVVSVRRVGTIGTPDTGLTRYHQNLRVQRG